jgi:hypothetical protein
MIQNMTALMARIKMVNIIFRCVDQPGRHQISGKANGPTQNTAKTMVELRKSQGVGGLEIGADGLEPSRNSPQCLHLMAASWMSSAQKGHFFI